jgi:hypothetical protein
VVCGYYCKEICSFSHVKSVPKHTKQHAKRGVPVSVGKRLLLIVGGLLLVVLIGFAAVHYASTSKPEQTKLPADLVQGIQPGKSRQPATLAEMLALKPENLPAVDIGVMNLLCAEGLPGAEDIKIADYETTLDEWAMHVKSETDRNFHHFREDPAYYYHSEAFYKMLMMAVVVYEDFGIRYNPKWIGPPSETRTDDHFFADSRDIFIHGMVGPQRMGTCSSMPVFYIALGRRLGYPLKLVATRGHLFMRWDSPTERFDMDATGKGLDRYDDEYYKKWPFSITEQEIQDEGYLKSLSPREEMSVFLGIRAACLAENRFYEEAAKSYQIAYQYAPNWKGNQVMLARAQQRQQRPARLVVQQQADNVVVRQQGENPNAPADPSPFQSLQNPMRNP